MARAFVIAAVLASLLAACGGGGGAGAPAQGTISGNVVKGPLAGAVVTALSVSGGVVGGRIASTTTAADGSFTIAVGDQPGPVFVQATGGTYIEEATGLPADMLEGDTLSAAVPTITPGALTVGIQVTPLTGMAQRMAARLPGGLTEANIAAAQQAVGRYFSVGDILRTRPIDPLVSGSAVGANASAINYGMTLGAFSQYAHDAGYPRAARFVAALMNDAADAQLDGSDGSDTLTILRDPLGGGLPAPDAGSAGLAHALTAFASSPMNASGATATSVAPLAQQLAASGGLLR